jgi:hypothetical protein
VDAVERSDDPAVGQMLKEHIERFNMATTGITEWHQLTYVVRDDDGELAGGVDGWEWGGYARVGEVGGYPRGHSLISLAKPLS